jgi:hypothetical protein
MKYDKETLKLGLPKIYEKPDCAKCNKPKSAFILNQEHGIICGHCLEQITKEEKQVHDFIIQEAKKRMAKP